jgi:hypothetical protein
MQIRPRGPLRLALPLVRRRMQRQLARDVVTIKARLKGGRNHHWAAQAGERVPGRIGS